MEQSEDRHQRGMDMLKTMFGVNAETEVEKLRAANPELARCLIEFPFAEVYTRPGLDLRTREMLTIAALTVLGYPQTELKEHVRGALNIGCTTEQIMEIVLQMAVYAGFPAALEAAKTAASVFAEAKMKASQSDNCGGNV